MRTPLRGTPVVAAVITAIAAILIVVLPAANAVAASPKNSGTSSQSHSGPGKSQKPKPPSAGSRGPDAKTLNPRPPAPRNNAPSQSSPGTGAPGGSHQQAPPKKPRKPIPKPDRGPHKFSPKTKAPGNSSNYDKPGSNRDKSGSSARDRDERDGRSGPSQNRGPNKFSPRTPSRPDTSSDRGSHSTPGADKNKSKRPRDRSEDVPATPMDNPAMDGTDNNGDGIVDNENPYEELPVIEIQPPRGGGGPLPGLKPSGPQSPRAQTPKEGAPKEGAPAENAPGKNDRSDRGDGRDERGRFANGNDGRSGKAAEKRELDNLEKRTGKPIIREQRQARIDGVPRSRFYDGLIPNGDGTYSGIEVKSGGAKKSGWQKRFDDMVSPERPAYVKLPDGSRVKITKVIDITAPE
ncbi:hypothetical protein [Gordonia sp. OPL2]|uniref:hypothetical protein n=1 Tax=Gordonia sp. OPL2 TaxID=2486274 RepID=UPI001655E624|nr:hypothetical protein [Gordonia sp. OPL2]RPA06115.1 hypothetical protein EEB19_09560 [Gordonia sp. OPL2]